MSRQSKAKRDARKKQQGARPIRRLGRPVQPVAQLRDEAGELVGGGGLRDQEWLLLLGGQVAGYSTALGSYLPHLKGDRLRLLAVSSAARNAIVPDVPTYREEGFALDMVEWLGVFVPKGTPPAVVQRLASAVQAAVAHPEFSKGLADFGMTPRSSTPQAFAEQLRVETEQWRVEIKKLGFTAES